jgi:hypothetical protein
MSFLLSILLSIAATFGFHPMIGGGGPVHMSISSESGPASAQPASGGGPVGKKKK